MCKHTDREVQALRAENVHLQDLVDRQSEQIVRQQEQIAALLKRVAELEERVNKNSRNSSKPPSSDSLAVSPKPKKPRTGRNRGGQPGHKGKKRELLPPERVDEVVDVKPECCSKCGLGLDGKDPTPLQHQVTEIPPIRPHVTEYRLHMLACPGCGERNFSQLPDGVPHGAFGFRLQGTVAMCSGAYRLSKRTVLALLSDILGVKMALGSVSRCEKNVSSALAKPVAEAQEFVEDQPVVNADETSWRESRNKAWLWVAVSSLVTIFQIHAGRGMKAAEALLGGFAGVLGSDRWGAYNIFELNRRQFCWAHLIRDFQAISERQGDAKRIGDALLAGSKELFTLWHEFRDGTIDRARLNIRAGPIITKVKILLDDGATGSEEKTAGTCRNLVKGFPALWTFLREPGVEPTNNSAERAVRKGVLWRKSSFGTDSEQGSRFAERVMTVDATCRQQKRNTLEFLVSALRADHGKHQPPSLLPD